MSFISVQRVRVATGFNNSQICNPFRSSDYTDSESEEENMDETLRAMKDAARGTYDRVP